MSGTRRQPGEIAFSILLVLFSVTAFWQSFEISGFRGLSEPGVFPMLATAAMLLSSMLVLREAIAKIPSTGSPEITFFKDIASFRLLVMFGLILAYVAAMPLVGFLISSAAFLFASIWFLWRKGPLASALLTAVSLTVVYFVFRILFQVVLPGGTLVKGFV